MKKILFLIAVCFAFISCNMNAKNGTEAQTQKEVTVKDHVEVLYFMESSVAQPVWLSKATQKLRWKKVLPSRSKKVRSFLR